MTPDVNLQFVETHLQIAGRQGNELSVCCPIHGEKNASMRINVDKGVYFCHSCHAKGSMVNLAKFLGVSYRYNKAEAGMVKLRSKLDLLRKGPQADEELVLSEDVLKRYSLGNTRYWTAPRPHGRGLSEETVEAFELGYDPMNDAAIIPIRNMWGELLGVTRRYLGDDVRTKYKDPKGFQKRKHLFGSWFVAQAESPTVVLTEGPLDAIKVWQAGHPAVAVYGSYLTEHQIMLLRRLGVITCVLMFDNDKSGIKSLKWAKGFQEDNTGKWHYNPSTDLRKFFVLKKTSYKGVVGKDPGDLSDREIDRIVLGASTMLR